MARGIVGRGAPVLVAAVLTLLPVAAQSSRVAANTGLLEQFPGFFQGREIAVVAQAVEDGGLWTLPIAGDRTFVLLPEHGAPPDGRAEFRGVFLDVGRLSGERRLSQYPKLQTLVDQRYEGREPPRDTLFALAQAVWVPAPDASTPSLRTIVLEPETAGADTVTLRGRFRGQNLFGDLPHWPRQSRWDFVLQLADASIWVTGLRPRGDGFDLDPTSRRNAGTWLEVSGVVHVERGVPRLEATRVARSTPVEDAPERVSAPEPPPEPPPAVIFSAPVDGETDVPRAQPVRVQFSRDMASDSFADHVRVTYGEGATDPVPTYTTTYLPGTRGIEIAFDAPLAPAAHVTVELLAGITARDGTPLAPTTLSFTVER